MKYTTKTAIEIMTEEDKPQLIPFMESIIPTCNTGRTFPIGIDILRVGDIWYIGDKGHLRLANPYKDLSDYTILKGVPKDWREESEPNYICSECGTEQEYIELVKADNGHDYSNYCKKCGELIESNGKYYGLTKTTPEPTEPSRLDKLESENNELKDNQIPKSLIDLVYNVKRMVECYQYGKIGIAERELGLIKESLDDIMRLPKEKTQDF